MENQVSSKSIIINYGLGLGVISLFPALIKYAMGGNYLENDTISGLLGFAFTIVFIVLAYRNFKTANAGYMSWGKGLKIGMGIVLISLFVTILYLLVFTNYIEPDFKNLAIAAAEEKWVDAGMTSDQIDLFKTNTNKYFNLSLYGGIVIVSLFIGFVISAITSAIMKESAEEQY